MVHVDEITPAPQKTKQKNKQKTNKQNNNKNNNKHTNKKQTNDNRGFCFKMPK